jgi:Ca2+-binding EF-hand superfamily protein
MVSAAGRRSMNIAKIIAFAVTMTLAGSTALAGARGHGKHQAGDKAQRMLQKFDSNHDGVLDASELEAMAAHRAQRRAQRFQRFDRDGDGTLNKAEKQAFKQERRAMKTRKRAARKLARLDQNNDGALSWSEVSANPRATRLKQRFHAIDSNGDGLLTRAELEQAARTHKHKGKKAHKAR